MKDTPKEQLEKVTLLHLAMSLPETCTAHEVLKYFYLIGAADGIADSVGGAKYDFNKRFNEFVESATKIDHSIKP